MSKQSKTARALKSLDALFTEIGLAPLATEVPGFVPLTRDDAALLAGHEPQRAGGFIPDRLTCPTGKSRYTSEAQARTSIRHIEGRGTSNNGAMISYLCDQCHGWHLTTRAPIPKKHRRH